LGSLEIRAKGQGSAGGSVIETSGIAGAMPGRGFAGLLSAAMMKCLP
jgi:hypothetical protein